LGSETTNLCINDNDRPAIYLNRCAGILDGDGISPLWGPARIVAVVLCERQRGNNAYQPAYHNDSPQG